MKENKRVLMIGCGSANLFAAVALAESGLIGSGIELVIVDSGKDPYERTDLVRGFAGAGLFSDGKLVFSSHPDPISEHVPYPDRMRYHDYIKRVVSDHVKIDESHISQQLSPKGLQVQMSRGDYHFPEWLTLRQSDVWHIGTSNNLTLGKSLYEYLKSSGVIFKFGASAHLGSIDPSERCILVSDEGSPDTHWHEFYDYLIIGVGKVGAKNVRHLAAAHPELDLMAGGNVNIGGRFETIYNNKVRHMAEKIQYDFKLSSSYDDPCMDIRTFCVNNGSAHVIEEKIFDGRRQVMTYNGHAYGLDNTDHWTGKSNFGIIARMPHSDPNSVHRKLLEWFSSKVGTVIRGAGWDGTGSLDVKYVGKPTYQSVWSFENYRDVMEQTLPDRGGIIVDRIEEFIKTINKSFGLKDNWQFHIPEIKDAAGVVATEHDFSTKNGRGAGWDRIYWVGDACTGGVGIVPSAVSGLKVADDIHNKCK